jgi:hypothetical protein
MKKTGAKIQTLEKRDSEQAAKSSGVQPEQSGALSKLRFVQNAQLALFLGWLCRVAALGGW